MADTEQPNDELPKTSDDGLPLDPELRRAAVLAQFDEFQAQLDALTVPEDTMADTERDEIEDADETRQRQALAQSAKIQAALIAVLDAVSGWAEPLIMAHAQAAVLQTSLVGIMKLDPSRVPWARTLAAQVHDYVAETAAVIAPSEIKH